MDNLLIKDMQLNPDLQNDLSSAAKQKRMDNKKKWGEIKQTRIKIKL